MPSTLCSPPPRSKSSATVALIAAAKCTGTMLLLSEKQLGQVDYAAVKAAVAATVKVCVWPVGRGCQPCIFQYLLLPCLLQPCSILFLSHLQHQSMPPSGVGDFQYLPNALSVVNTEEILFFGTMLLSELSLFSRTQIPRISKVTFFLVSDQPQLFCDFDFCTQ